MNMRSTRTRKKSKVNLVYLI